MSLLSFIPTRTLDLSSMQEIGHGAERRCFVDPRHPRLLYKCSTLINCRQSLKEAGYYRHLQKRHVPMTHLPRMFDCFKTESDFVMVQECIRDSSRFKVYDFPKLISDPRFDMAYLPQLQRAYASFRDYLIRYRIVTNDTFAHNFMVKIPSDCNPFTADKDTTPLTAPDTKPWKLMLIDGLGSVSLIPLANYVRTLAEKRIRRQCLKFVSSVQSTSQGRIVLIPFD